MQVQRNTIYVNFYVEYLNTRVKMFPTDFEHTNLSEN